MSCDVLPVHAPEGGVVDEELRNLVKRGDARDALAAYEAACSRFQGFRPCNSDVVVSLARAALAAGRPQVAGRLLHAFDRLYPGHEAMPLVYLLTARVFMCLSKDEISVNYLEAIVRRFPSHPIAAEAREVLEGLSGAWRARVH